MFSTVFVSSASDNPDRAINNRADPTLVLVPGSFTFNSVRTDMYGCTICGIGTNAGI